MLSRYEQFTLSVATLYQDIQKIQRSEMTKFGLKGPHAQVLLTLTHFPEGITGAELSQRSEKDKAAVSRTVAELEDMNMVERTMPGSSRYRAKITLTEQGKAVAEAVNQTAQLAVEKAGMGLEEEQRQIFYQVLNLISGNLHAICQKGLTDTKGE